MAFKLKLPNQLNLGLTLASVVTISTLWLGYSKNLNLYISNRYDFFAVFMAFISLLFLVLTFVINHHLRSSESRRKTTTATIIVTVITGLLALTFLILQPKTLTSATALQRGINAGGLNLSTVTNTVGFGATNYSQFDIRDWASVLSQTSTISFYSNKTANLLGFVSPMPSGNPDVFYVSRFYITCCAIDAQPYGVPIYMPNWQKTYPANSWVQVSGIFEVDPGKSSATPIVLKPLKINAVAEPQDPYVR